MAQLNYEDIKKWDLMDKIKIFGWLSDLLTYENPDVAIQMHQDKIKRIKLSIKTESD